MTKPMLAIKESDLARSSAPPPTKSGHSVEKVFFSPSATGLRGLGFFKRCDSSYCALRAKYNVARSVFYRATLGNRASEERLVYNLNDEISGTVSIAIPGFVPLQKLNDANPSTYEESMLSNPSTDTLTERNVAELFVANYRHLNDDVHPDNFSLAGIIDLDMCGIENIALKDERITSGLIHSSQACATIFLSGDLDEFPVLKSLRIHWPTHSVPLNGNVLKTYKGHNHFAKLKDSPLFREQAFTAFLKELLMFQEQPLKKRLDAHLGKDSPIDLDGLAPATGGENIRKNNLLSLMNRDLFYKKTKQNKLQERSFTDHFMRHMKNEYNSLYTMLTNYPEFNNFLFSNPSAYLTVRNFFADENIKFPLEQQYDLEKMDIYYEKILRDSLRPAIFRQLNNTQTIIDNIKKELVQNSYFGGIFSPRGKAEPKAEKGHCTFGQTTNSSTEIKNALESLLASLCHQVTELFEQEEPNVDTNEEFVQSMQRSLDSTNEQIVLLTKGRNFNQSPDYQELMNEWRSTLSHLTHQTDSVTSAYTKSPIFRYTSSHSADAPEEHVKLPNNIDEIISDSLVSWLSESSFDDLKVCISMAIKDYDPKRKITGLFWRNESRTPSIINLLREEESKEEGQRPTAAQLVKHILTAKNSGWNDSSFNTILMKILLQKSFPITRAKLAYFNHVKALINFEKQMSDRNFLYNHILSIKNEFLLNLGDHSTASIASAEAATTLSSCT